MSAQGNVPENGLVPTPDVTYTHDRLGRVVEAMTAGVCTNTYSYDVATLARSGETRSSIFGPTETLVRQQDVLGRPAGLTLGNDYAVGYGYDAVGRFGTVASTNTANAVTGQWTYERVPGSDLVAGWTADAGNYWRRSYEAQRDLIAETHSGHDATVLDSYAYTNDALGRRTARVDASVTTNAFGYNLRSEVISAMMGSDQFGYGYDPIGNRLTATNNTSVTTYCANELNQYTNIVSGASVTPTYDDDGNMLAFGNGWTATWDGENRLVQLTKDGEQIGYAYDHQSRRIAKQTAAGTEVFSYDDWAMIRHTAPGGAKTDYIYGLDLSGTPQGAGTVGGLLGMVRAGDTAPISYGYDANGNVTLLADGSGAVAARYAYDPFGNTLSATGTLAAVNPFRFSTKYCEDEVGLYYYGYRYYSSELGRWVGRDPIGEGGGINLHAALLNAPVNLVDPDGYMPQKSGSAVTDPSRVNCAGGALGDGTYLAPAKGASWKDVATERGFGDFKQIKSSKECEEHCGACRDAVVMYVPKYHDKKDPFNEPYDPQAPAGSGYRDKNGDWVYDVHFAIRPAYFSAARPQYPWYHIPGVKDRPASIDPSSYVWPLYDKNHDPLDPDDYVRRHYGVDAPSSMWCMCKDKK